jgi:hypothetical protein
LHQQSHGSLTHSLTHLLTHSLTYLLTQALSTLTASAGGNAFLTRCHGVFTDLCTKHASSYDINGVNAIFHEYVVPSDEDGNPLVRATLSTRPAVNGSSCWDTLWEACYIAADLISQGTHYSLTYSLTYLITYLLTNSRYIICSTILYVSTCITSYYDIYYSSW